MNCPDCSSSMEMNDLRGIEVQECPSCKGRWFDRNELKKAKDNTDEDLCWLDFDPFGQKAKEFEVKPEGVTCPQCSIHMDSLAYENSGVVINKCSDCQGIWVHHGEFTKIIRYLEELVVSKTSPEYVKDTLKQFLEMLTEREHINEEVKDFLVVFKLLEQRFGVEHPEIIAATKTISQYFPFL